MSDVHLWNTTDASNGTGVPNDWPEGMDYRQVNNVGRANMGAIARWWTNTSGTISTAGTANARTLASQRTDTATTYANGERYLVKSHIANTGAVTIAVNGRAAVPLVGPNLSALSGGLLGANTLFGMVYDTNRFIITSPLGGTASLTVDDIPDLPASKITSGVFANDRMFRVMTQAAFNALNQGQRNGLIFTQG